jgi:hypothetical protein
MPEIKPREFLYVGPFQSIYVGKEGRCIVKYIRSLSKVIEKTNGRERKRSIGLFKKQPRIPMYFLNGGPT